MPHIAVIGAAVAGTKFVQTLRAEGFDGDVTLVDLEPEPLYDRPPLSKKYLQGKQDGNEIALDSATGLSRLGVRTRFGIRATGLNPRAKIVSLSDGSELPYDSLVIATGATPRLTPWASLPGVYVLRTRDDSDTLRTALVRGRHLAVIGAGFIGAEVAAAAREAGMRVTMIEPLATPMSRVMNSKVGAIFADKYRAEGVELRFRVFVDDVTATADGLRLSLSDGETVDADSVLLGIGTVVNTKWLESSGLTLDNGVCCDSTMAAIGCDGVYAIGDVARYFDVKRWEAVRHEHWTSAVDQASLVAHNVTHPDDLRRFDATEYVWSDQYDWKIQIVGRPGCNDWSIVGEPESGRFAVVYGLSTSPVQGVIVVNWPRALVDARRSVVARVPAADLINRLSGLLETLKARL